MEGKNGSDETANLYFLVQATGGKGVQSVNPLTEAFKMLCQWECSGNGLYDPDPEAQRGMIVVLEEVEGNTMHVVSCLYETAVLPKPLS